MNMIYKKKLGRIYYISYFCSLIAKYLNYRKLHTIIYLTTN